MVDQLTYVGGKTPVHVHEWVAGLMNHLEVVWTFWWLRQPRRMKMNDLRCLVLACIKSRKTIKG